MTLHESKSELPELLPQNGAGKGAAVETPGASISKTKEKSLKKSPVSPQKRAFYQKISTKAAFLRKTGPSDYDLTPCHNDPTPCNHDLDPCRQQLLSPTYFSHFSNF